MCLSIPMQVVALEGDGDFAWVERAGRRELVNMMRFATPPAISPPARNPPLTRMSWNETSRHADVTPGK